VRRYHVMLHSGDSRTTAVSADFPFPATTHCWLGAMWLAWRFRKHFNVTIVIPEST